MKKLLLITALALTMALGLGALTACTSNDDDERRTLVMGTNAAFFPFQFIADPGQGVIGQYAGIDVSLVARIAEELDVNIVIQDQEFAGLLLALQNREIDFVAAAMTIRPDRQEIVNFSVPYFNAGQFIITREADTHINSIADLEGLLVAVQLGTTGDIALTEGQDAGYVTFGDILTYNQPLPALMDLLNGGIDALVIDAPVARAFYATYDGLRILPDPNNFFGPEEFGLAFHQEDTDLLAEFNAVLSRLISEGFIDYLYEYYNTEHSPAGE